MRSDEIGGCLFGSTDEALTSDVVEFEYGLLFQMVPTGVTYHRVSLHSIHLAPSCSD